MFVIFSSIHDFGEPSLCREKSQAKLVLVFVQQTNSPCKAWERDFQQGLKNAQNIGVSSILDHATYFISRKCSNFDHRIC